MRTASAKVLLALSLGLVAAAPIAHQGAGQIEAQIAQGGSAQMGMVMAGGELGGARTVADDDTPWPPRP